MAPHAVIKTHGGFMNTIIKKMTSFLCLLIATGAGLSTTGCASGGYKLTRQYARFVNSQNIIIRIVLYIFTSIVFFATLLVDAVVFNTMDFWNGTVSQGTYEFTQENKKFFVKHEVDNNHFKKSTVEVVSLDGKHLQDVVIQQTSQTDIAVFVNGKLHSKISDIHRFPLATLFDAQGRAVGLKAVLQNDMVAQK